MTLATVRRAMSATSVRAAASTLLLTAVASAATVLVLTQATSVFSDNSTARTNAEIFARDLPPIIVPVRPATGPGTSELSTPPKTVTLTLTTLPPATTTTTPTPTPTPTPTTPTTTPDRVPAPAVSTEPPTAPAPTPTPAPTPAPSPSKSTTESGLGGGKTLTPLLAGSPGRSAGASVGEAAHLSSCVAGKKGQVCSNGHGTTATTATHGDGRGRHADRSDPAGARKRPGHR